jgi:endonuclease III
MNKKQEKIISILKILRKQYPGGGAMEVGGAYQSLVGVLLSARTRDEQVLLLMPGFFKAFPTVEILAKATEAQIRSKINTIGLFRAKANHLKKMAERIVEVYDGRIPHTMEDLTSLAGVGRKTASVILPYIYKQPAIAVDTHVHRVTNRLGWVNTKSPQKTEQDLLKLIPDKYKTTVNRVFVRFGRYICIGKPRCWACPIADQCPFKQKNLERPKNADEILSKISLRETRIEEMKKAVEEAG